MSAKDRFHQAVKTGLQKEKWRIVEDPLNLTWEEVELRIDLAADRVVAADREDEKIAVEIKSFLEQSTVYSFHGAVGQFMSYRTMLAEKDPDRRLYLAVPLDTYKSFFQQPFTRAVIQQNRIPLIVYSAVNEEIVLWIN
jgi:hypothetical protein